LTQTFLERRFRVFLRSRCDSFSRTHLSVPGRNRAPTFPLLRIGRETPLPIGQVTKAFSRWRGPLPLTIVAEFVFPIFPVLIPVQSTFFFDIPLPAFSGNNDVARPFLFSPFAFLTTARRSWPLPFFLREVIEFFLLKQFSGSLFPLSPPACRVLRYC